MSRPSATRPGGWAKACWRASRARSAAAARRPRGRRRPRRLSERSSPVHVLAGEGHELAAIRAHAEVTSMTSGPLGVAGDVVRSETAAGRLRGRPGGRAPRCRAGASRRAGRRAGRWCLFRSPLGPSMVTIGAGAIGSEYQERRYRASAGGRKRFEPPGGLGSCRTEALIRAASKRSARSAARRSGQSERIPGTMWRRSRRRAPRWARTPGHWPPRKPSRSGDPHGCRRYRRRSRRPAIQHAVGEQLVFHAEPAETLRP